MMKIKNDIAEAILATDHVARARLLKPSRFKVSERRPVIDPLQRNSPSTPMLSSVSSEKKLAIAPASVDEDHPSYELVYDMLNGINNAVVEAYAQRASREEDLDLNYSIRLIALLPKDFEYVNNFAYTT